MPPRHFKKAQSGHTREEAKQINCEQCYKTDFPKMNQLKKVSSDAWTCAENVIKMPILSISTCTLKLFVALKWLIFVVSAKGEIQIFKISSKKRFYDNDYRSQCKD